MLYIEREILGQIIKIPVTEQEIKRLYLQMLSIKYKERENT